MVNMQYLRAYYESACQTLSEYILVISLSCLLPETIAEIGGIPGKNMLIYNSLCNKNIKKIYLIVFKICTRSEYLLKV